MRQKLILITGLIYIVGGCTHNSRHRQDVLSYNPVTREWDSLAPMLTPRSQMGIAVLEGYMYVVGGTNKNQEVLASVERYSFNEVSLFKNQFSQPFFNVKLLIWHGVNSQNRDVEDVFLAYFEFRQIYGLCNNPYLVTTYIKLPNKSSYLY